MAGRLGPIAVIITDLPSLWLLGYNLDLPPTLVNVNVGKYTIHHGNPS